MHQKRLFLASSILAIGIVGILAFLLWNVLTIRCELAALAYLPLAKISDAHMTGACISVQTGMRDLQPHGMGCEDAMSQKECRQWKNDVLCSMTSFRPNETCADVENTK